MYVNLPDEHCVAVIDAATARLKLSATWPVEAGDNFAMAIDGPARRLFVICRKPAKVICYSTEGGQVLSSADCVGDCDDAFYDAKLGRLFVIGGEGFVDVLAVDASSSAMTRTGRVATAPGARTGLYVPELGLLCVAAPAVEEGVPARVLLFKVSPASNGP